MTIKTFTQGFQDHIFVRNPIFYLLDKPKNISSSDIFVTVKHAEALIQDFSDSAHFLEKESESIVKEIDTIFKSLNSKIDRINNYSSALINLNSTFEDRYLVKNINPYNLESISQHWNYTESCLTLPGTSSKVTYSPYRILEEDKVKKKTYYFTVPTTITYSGISISKKFKNTDITSIEVLGSKKNSLERKNIKTNVGSSSVYSDIPIGSYIIIIETVSDDSEVLTITPYTFNYENYKEYSLEKFTYTYTDFFTLQTAHTLPSDCYLQIDMQFIFYDINNQFISQEFGSVSLDNNGNLIEFYKNIPNIPHSSFLTFYRDGSKQDANTVNDFLPDDVIIYRAKNNDSISIVSENTLRFKVRNAKKFSCIPTIKMHSLTNEKQTPKLYNITGITKNDNSK